MVRKEDGQSLVEFALVLPILLLLMVGIFDFGRLLYTHLHMEILTQESVRISGLGQGDDAVRTYAMNHFEAGDPSKLEVTIDPAAIDRRSGDYVTVTLVYSETFLQPLGNASISYDVKTISTIRVE